MVNINGSDGNSDQLAIAIIDTNILMENAQVFDIDWGVPNIHVHILFNVLEELRGLSTDKSDQQKAQRAKDAWKFLDDLHKRTSTDGIPIDGGRGYLFFSPCPESVKPPLDSNNVDHQLIAFAQQCMAENPKSSCAIITMDRELSDIGASAYPSVRSVIPSRYSLAESLKTRFSRQYEWWVKWGQNGSASTPADHTKEQSIKPPRPPRPVASDPEIYLQRLSRNYYSRIRAARHRAILAIAPLQARIVLTAHLTDVLTQKFGRIAFLYVSDQISAEYWAAEIRQRCHLPAESVLVFREKGLPSGKTAQVVIYRYDQIETRFRHHMARFKSGNRRISVIVDGCDLLSPEQLALLLFGDHQFIGYTRYNFNHAQSRSGRLLAQFFEQQTILGYTFADAEQDGWLRAFDLIRNPIPFQNEEAVAYHQANIEFIQSNDKVRQTYPSLRKFPAFWGDLHTILENVADAGSARLYELRERREELAQIAKGKLSSMVTMLTDGGSKNTRNIIYDPTGLWIPVLKNELKEHELEISDGADLITEKQWNAAWQMFVNGKIHCLLLSDTPHFRLSQSPIINRLIITTPLSSLTKLASITDWVLSHTQPFDPNPVEIHLLYVPETPEEQAMLDFADTVCGLHFVQ